jgi:hypothetical protein
MTNTEKRIDFFYKLCQLVIKLREKGINVMPFSFYRSQDEQKLKVIQGLSKTLNSKHCQWLACDLVIIKEGELIWSNDPDYKTLGEIAKELGLVWGGDFKFALDIYHVEYP